MIWEKLVDFVYPEICVGCGIWGTFLCRECSDRLDFADQICPMCGEGSLMGWTHDECKTKDGLDGLIAIYEYSEPVARAVIDGVKYGFNKVLVKTVLSNFSFETGEQFDFLVPLPLHFYRENWRGFNQAEVVAEVVRSQIIDVRLERVLIRNRNTKQQVTMKSREERENNVKGAFDVRKEWRRKLKGMKLLLVDDVFTSGADMKECTKVLKKAGVSVVWGLALAH